MLGQDALMELGALSQHGVGKRDPETAALIAEQVGEAARLIILFRREVGIGNLGDRNDEKTQPCSLQDAGSGKDSVVGVQVEVAKVPDGHR